MLELKQNPLFYTERETSNKLFKVIHLEKGSQDQVLGFLTHLMEGMLYVLIQEK